MSKKKQEDPQVEAEEQDVTSPEEEAPENEAEATAATEESKDDSEVKIAELNNRYLRLAAEFENYKKRNQRERLQLMETAGRKTMMSLLPVLDDFDRAKQAVAQASEEKQADFAGGMGLIIKKLYDSLAAQGLKPMESTGEPFDADRHEAITEIPHPEMSGKVVDTVEKGYTLNGNIIRYAKVVVGK